MSEPTQSDFLSNRVVYLEDKVIDLESKLSKARECLIWYSADAWKATTPMQGGQQIYTPIDRDNGQRARECLAGIGGE